MLRAIMCTTREGQRLGPCAQCMVLCAIRNIHTPPVHAAHNAHQQPLLDTGYLSPGPRCCLHNKCLDNSATARVYESGRWSCIISADSVR
jgi:hypothetical protein